MQERWRQQRRTVRLELQDSIFWLLLEHHIALFRPQQRAHLFPPLIPDHTARCRLLTCKPTVRLIGGIDCPRSAPRHWQANFFKTLPNSAVPGDRVSASQIIADLSKAVASAVGKPESVSSTRRRRQTAAEVSVHRHQFSLCCRCLLRSMF
jgi:hypothetical protein